MQPSGRSTDPPRTPLAADPTCRRLTRSEQAVALLIGEGLEDRAVARQLGLKLATVQNYIRRIQLRLRLNSRGELAAWVAARRTAAEPERSLHRVEGDASV